MYFMTKLVLAAALSVIPVNSSAVKSIPSHSVVLDKREHKCLTEAVYYEARNDTEQGQQAVADVVLNRVEHKAYPNSVCKVVYQKGQFSWSANKPAVKEKEAWETIEKLTERKLKRQYALVREDVTSGATHFQKSEKGWKGTIKIGKIGKHHIFFRLVK